MVKLVLFLMHQCININIYIQYLIEKTWSYAITYATAINPKETPELQCEVKMLAGLARLAEVSMKVFERDINILTDLYLSVLLSFT